MSRNCANRDLMKKLIEQAFVGNDAPKAKSGRPTRDKKRGGALTGRKGSGRLTEKNKPKQETDSEVESELESLSDSDSEAGNRKGAQ